MAGFCLNYLLSSPVALGIANDELRRHSQSGYYAFHDYASVHWSDHLIHLKNDCINFADEVQTSLISRYRSLLKWTESSEHSLIQSSKMDPGQIDEMIKDIPQDARSRDRRYQITLRTSRIRSVIEAMMEEFKDGNPARLVLCDMYGSRLFKCGKVDCRYYLEGFDTRSARDRHLQKHERSYTCVHQACPFQTLGFENEPQLRKHIENAHAAEDDDRFAFPKARRKNADTLCNAAARGDIAAVKGLLDQAHSINQPSRTKGGLTPLVLAVRNGHSKISKLLLEKGANAWYRGPREAQNTAFDAAIANGDIETMHYLLTIPEADTKLGIVGDQLGSILRSAIEQGHPVMVKMILDFKSRYHILIKTTSLHSLSSVREKEYCIDLAQLMLVKSDQNEVFRILHGHVEAKSCWRFFGDLFNMSSGPIVIGLQKWDEAERGAIHRALDHQPWDTIRVFMKPSLLNLNAIDRHGRTPLRRMIDEFEIRTASNELSVDHLISIIDNLLHQPGLNPNIVDRKGRSPLIRAAQLNLIHCVGLLLSVDDIETNLIDKEGRTALSRALEHGETDSVSIIQSDRKFDVNAQDDRGETMLSRAVRAARHGEVNRLVALEGIDLQLQNHDGKTPSDLVNELQRLAQEGNSDHLSQFMKQDLVESDPISTGDGFERMKSLDKLYHIACVSDWMESRLFEERSRSFQRMASEIIDSIDQHGYIKWDPVMNKLLFRHQQETQILLLEYHSINEYQGRSNAVNPQREMRLRAHYYKKLLDIEQEQEKLSV
ncbi:MAG: hypothetical protein Q9220_007430 [cf. Caloplaca sp. 1 TL-2023]